MNNWLQIPGTAIWVRTYPTGIRVVKPNVSDVHYEAYRMPADGGAPKLIGTAATPVRAAALFDQVTA